MKKSSALRDDAPTTPTGLSAEAYARWQELEDEYHIVDSGGRAILRLHCESLMTVRAAEAILEHEGLVVVDRFGQAKAHPATVVLRDARSMMLQSLRALNLDVQGANGRSE